MDVRDRILVWLLRLGGAVMLMALGAVVMPFDWMSLIHARLGLGELPHRPIVGYLTRSASLLYALHGALFLFLSWDLNRYLPVVRFLAVAGIVFGIVVFGIDHFAGMPLWWALGEASSIIVFGVVILWLAGRGKTNSKTT